MCTLTLAWQVFDDAPVAVAANRDEALDRDSRPPELYGEDPLVVAPRDADAGGTWLGYNEFGVAAGITNKWTDADLAGDRSRGLLVADVLEARSVSDATAIVEARSVSDATAIVEDATAADEYEGFSLVIADAATAVCYQWDGDLSVTEFDPGVHVVVNVAVDDDVDLPSSRPDVGRTQADNARRVRAALAADADESVTEWLTRAGTVLGDHEFGVCVHGDGYGTRSSSLLAVGPGSAAPERPPEATYRFADGPPCETPYRPVELGREDDGNDGDTERVAALTAAPASAFGTTTHRNE
ncbi:NRDE family protein [Natrialba asiatica]|uniref:NRDE family protein n=1 Tax=Natrialba asiatica (strain ATCC 700177 / DSM 12278 / JCM 9576 / FERM P-10747 / NBRC 102637 / 172P1) TaxID=29540 RepID=M0AQY3_NATA1|nr:NRDE family protein [Natrialba asiatica]ELZ00945.1 hypothetical protein C481_10620 [Natrialba asiatica DSM 12278]